MTDDVGGERNKGDLLEECLDAMIHAQIFPNVTIDDYIQMPAREAERLIGPLFECEPGKPRFHALDIIRIDQYERADKAVLAPLLSAAFGVLVKRGLLTEQALELMKGIDNGA